MELRGHGYIRLRYQAVRRAIVLTPSQTRTETASLWALAKTIGSYTIPTLYLLLLQDLLSHPESTAGESAVCNNVS